MRWISGESGGDYQMEDSAFAGGPRTRIHRCRDAAGNPLVYKAYSEPLDGADTLLRLTEVARLGRTADRGQAGFDAIGWPLDVVVHGQAVAGVVMRAAPSGFFNPGRDPRTFDRLHLPALYPPDAADRIRVLIDVCDQFACLERLGVIHGGVTAHRVLWRRGEQPHAFLIGGDRMRLPATSRPAGGAADVPADWRDPRLTAGLIDVPDTYSDRFALAGLIYRGLYLHASAPTLDSRGIPAHAPVIAPETDDGIKALFARSFADLKAHEPRPAPSEWREALSTALAANGGGLVDLLRTLDAAAEDDDLEPPPGRSASGAANRPVPPVTAQRDTTVSGVDDEPDEVAASGRETQDTSAGLQGRVTVMRDIMGGTWEVPSPAGASSSPALTGDPSQRRVLLLGAGLVGIVVLIVFVIVQSSRSSSPQDYSSSNYGSGSYQQPEYTQAPDGNSTQDALSATGQATDQPTDGSTDQATQTPDTAAAQEAQAVSEIVNSSASDRSLVAQAVQYEVGACQNVGQGVTDLQRAAADRQRLLQEVQQLDVSALDGGAQLQSDLANAFQHSYDADNAYAAWAQDVENAGCTGSAPTDDTNMSAGDADSAQATTSKDAFIQDWQPIAGQYSLPVPAEGDL